MVATTYKVRRHRFAVVVVAPATILGFAVMMDAIELGCRLSQGCTDDMKRVVLINESSEPIINSAGQMHKLTSQ
jgi:hypothetical protein